MIKCNVINKSTLQLLHLDNYYTNKLEKLLTQNEKNIHCIVNKQASCTQLFPQYLLLPKQEVGPISGRH